MEVYAAGHHPCGFVGYVHGGNCKILLTRLRIVYIADTDGRYGGAMAVGDGIDGVGARQMYLDTM
ncbi:MAG TPA: hypothetical protein H9845_09600 [Candidatus Agathobaculum pullicola]|nr:hypothetical protein [Candidatus Agathobaculum pullicola]